MTGGDPAFTIFGWVTIAICFVAFCGNMWAGEPNHAAANIACAGMIWLMMNAELRER